MNITADDIQDSCAGTNKIDCEIRTILRTFQSEIVNAGKNGHTSVIVPAPTNFNVPNMSNQTVQTIVYHRLIEECEDKGFNVKLSMDSTGVTYCIRWDIKQKSGDLKKMRNIIASHMVNKNVKKEDSEPVI